MNRIIPRFALVFTAALGFAAALPQTPARGDVPEIARVSSIPDAPPHETGVIRVFGAQLQGATVHTWQPEGDPDAIAASIDHLPKVAAMPAEPPKGAYEARVIETHDHVLLADLHWRIGNPGATVVWLKNDDGWSEPWLANRPQIFLTSHPRAMPGERLQLFGRRLSQISNRKINPSLVLKHNDTGALHEATWGKLRGQGALLSEGDHRVEFILPEDLPAGEYTLWYHSGSGNQYGWSKPMELSVLEARDLIDYEAMAWNRMGRQTDRQELQDVSVRKLPAELADEGKIYYWDVPAGEQRLIAQTGKTDRTAAEAARKGGMAEREVIPDTVKIRELEDKDKPQVIQVQIVREP